jgi:hypothetical protein
MRDCRRATPFHGMKVDRPEISYDRSNLSQNYERDIRPHETLAPILSPNPLGIAFGYVCLQTFVRRIN